MYTSRELDICSVRILSIPLALFGCGFPIAVSPIVISR